MEILWADSLRDMEEPVNFCWVTPLHVVDIMYYCAINIPDQYQEDTAVHGVPTCNVAQFDVFWLRSAVTAWLMVNK